MALSTRQSVPFALSIVLSAVLIWRVSPYLKVYNVDVGDRAPSFSLATEEGAGVSLDDYKGKWVLLNFWATWCPPCVQEVPSLNQLHLDLEPKGLVVLGVSVDADKQAYQGFLDQWTIAFPTVRDPEMTVSSVYGTHKFPESYLINPEGRVVRKYVGPENWLRPEIANYLRSLL